MELMGKYAAANHWCIHHHIAEHLGAQVLLDLENHPAGRAMPQGRERKVQLERREPFSQAARCDAHQCPIGEVPMAYKNIREVMAAQSDLVTVLGEFMPKLVKMAPSGERPED